MNLPPHVTVQNGKLAIGGIDCETLAGRYGTPLYVTDQDRIVSLFRSFRDALTARYPRVKVLYAAKANGNLAVLRALALEGAGADVFSSGELHLALSAGMAPGDLLFNGSSKSASDLSLAVESGVPVSVDSLDELHQLDGISRKAGKVTPIAFRVNPAIDVPTHRKIATGLATSKFGIPHDRVRDAYREALDCRGVEPVGIHCHIGSQILATEPFAEAARVMAGSPSSSSTSAGDWASRTTTTRTRGHRHRVNMHLPSSPRYGMFQPSWASHPRSGSNLGGSSSQTRRSSW